MYKKKPVFEFVVNSSFQYYTRCTTGPTNPFHGAISFDNIGLAWVAIFLVISLEGWTDVMYFVQVWESEIKTLIEATI